MLDGVRLSEARFEGKSAILRNAFLRLNSIYITQNTYS